MRAALKTPLAGVGVHLLLITSVATLIRVVPMSQSDRIWIEAENAILVYPFEGRAGGGEISGTGFVSIDEGRGGGVVTGTKGEARFGLDLDHRGDYRIWARVRWEDGCGNSFFVTVDEDNKMYILGEDGTYKEWHWVKLGVTVPLETGSHEIVFGNAEDGVHLDKVLVTNDLNYCPTGTGRTGAFNSDFADGRASGWNPITPSRWSVVNDPLSDRNALMLERSDLGSEEYSFVSEAIKSDRFVVATTVRVRTAETGARQYRVLFHYLDNANHYYVDLTETDIRLVRTKDGHDTVLALFDRYEVLRDDDYHDLVIERNRDSIRVNYDGKDVLTAYEATFHGGDVGIGSFYGGMYVAALQCAPLQDIHFASNFYALVNQLRFENEWHPVSGQWWRSLLFEPAFVYGVHSQTEARSITGEIFWQHYTLRAAVKSPSSAGVGLFAYYQDVGNHYLLRVAPRGSQKEYAEKLQLLRVAGGKREILGEAPVTFAADQWYDLALSVHDGKIVALVDNDKILTATDSVFERGKAGLYMDPPAERHTRSNHILVHEGGTGNEFGMGLSADLGADGIGIAFSFRDDANYYLLKYGPDTVHTSKSGLLQLLTFVGGKPTLLASEERGQYIPGLTYYLAVKTKPGHLTATFSDRVTFDLDIENLRPGHFGLYAGRQPEDAYFDDVEIETVKEYRAGLNPTPDDIAILTPSYRYRFAPRLSAGRDLTAWVPTSGYWNVSRHHSALVGVRRGGGDALVWHKPAITGDDVAIEAELRSDDGATPYVIICGDGFSQDVGYKCLVERRPDTAKITLMRNGVRVSSETVSAQNDQPLTAIRIQKTRKSIQIFTNDKALLEYTDKTPLTGGRVGFGVAGELHKPSYFCSVRIQ